MLKFGLEDDVIVHRLVRLHYLLIIFNTSFHVTICWFRLPQLTDSSIILSTLVLYFTPDFLPLHGIFNNNADKQSDALLSLDKTEERISVLLFL